ncbi:hypothetical protein D3C80_1983270 [compost metagenome]
MRYPHYGAKVLLGEVHHVLKRPTHVIGPVHIPLHRADDGVEHQQRHTAQLAHLVAQQADIVRWIEWVSLALSVEATSDDVHPGQIST